MTARPVNWAPLASSDPVPGDVAEVQGLASSLRRTAETIEEQVRALTNLCSDDYWESDAGDKFTETSKKTADQLKRVYDRYDAAATAVASYQPELAHAQTRSAQLLGEAQQLDHQMRQAQARVDHAEASGSTDDPSYGRDRSSVHDLGGRIGELARQLDGVVADRHAAARAAADRIDGVINHDGLKDSRWDKAKQWIHDHADLIRKIADIANKIALICGTLALVVGWIPIIGQALAAVLEVVALLATVVSLVCHIALYLSGDGGLLDIGLDVVGLVTFGLGRSAAMGMKAGAEGLSAASKGGSAASVTSSILGRKGITLGEDAVAALSKGDVRLASRLSGTPYNTMRGAYGNALGKAAEEFGDGGRKYIARMVDGAPLGASFPSLGRAFNPVEIGRETWDATTSLSPSAVRGAVQEIRLGHLGANMSELAHSMNALSHVGTSADNAVVQAVRSGLHFQMGSFVGNTVVGTASSWLDDAGAFDGAKEWGSRDPQW